MSMSAIVMRPKIQNIKNHAQTKKDIADRHQDSVGECDYNCGTKRLLAAEAAALAPVAE